MAFVVLVVYALILAFPFAEVVLYPGIVYNNIGFAPYWIVLIGIIFSVIVRIRTSKKLWEKIGIISLYLVVPAITVVSLILRYIELNNYPNFIYTLLHVDLTQTELLTLYIAALALPLLDIKFVKEHIAQTVLVVSILSYQLILLAWSHPDLYISLKREDGLIEYLTFACFFIAGVTVLQNIRFISVLSFSKQQKNLLLGLSLLMAVGLIVISGEEISWGQRLVGIETPEHLAELNTQQELNLHNNRNVFHFVYNAYLLINAYGLLSWIIFLVLKDKVSDFWQIVLRLCTSRWFLALFFIPNLTYVLLKEELGSAFSFQWEELSELYLSLGILALMILNVLYLKKRSQQKASNV